MDPRVFELLPQDFMLDVVWTHPRVGYPMFPARKEFGRSPHTRYERLPYALFGLPFNYLVDGGGIVCIEPEGELAIQGHRLHICRCQGFYVIGEGPVLGDAVVIDQTLLIDILFENEIKLGMVKRS